MGSTSPIDIAIIGGGISGLALAAGLIKKPHIKVHVYEGAPGYKDIGAGLALHKNAIGAMSLIGPEVLKAYFDKAINIGEDNEEMVTEDGTIVQTDCVIGGDGIHSAVRSHLLGPDHPATLPKNHDRWQVFRTLIPAEDAITNHGIDPRYTKIVTVMTGPQGHVNVIPLKKGAVLSAGVAVRGIATPDGSKSVSSATPTDNNELDTTLYTSYDPKAQPIIEMIASPKTPNTATWSVGDHDHAPFYSKSRIAMIGDAAHASLPFAGNGAAQALEDAAVIDCLFGRVTQISEVPAALLAYDGVRRKRSQDVVDLARKFGRVYAHCGDDQLDGQANDGERKSGETTPLVQDPERLRKFFAEASAFTNEFDLKKQNEDAVAAFEEALGRQFKP